MSVLTDVSEYARERLKVIAGFVDYDSSRREEK